MDTGRSRPGACAVDLRHCCEPDEALYILWSYATSSHDADTPLRLPHESRNGCASLHELAIVMTDTS